MYLKILCLSVLGCLLIACGGSPAPVSTNTPTPTATVPASLDPVTADVTIEITDKGFVPNKVSINKGQTVAFVNRDMRLHWPASGNHPTHSVYPETGGCIGSSFDACRGLKTGETYTFTFNQVGTWGVHDHLNPFGFFASIEVK